MDQQTAVIATRSLSDIPSTSAAKATIRNVEILSRVSKLANFAWVRAVPLWNDDELESSVVKSSLRISTI